MKSKFLRKFLAVGLVGTMAASMLAGCSGSSEQTTTSTSSGSEASTEASTDSASAEATTDGEVPTLIWWTVGGTIPSDFEEDMQVISDYVQEKVCVALDIQVAGWADYDSKMNTIVNSGEYFDLMFVNNTNYSKFVNLGGLADITDMVESVTPELYSFIPEDLWNGSRIKGQIYAVPTYKDSSLTQFWYFDDQYVQKYNIDYESIQTMDDLTPAFKAIKDGEGASFYPVQLNQGALWNGFFNEYDGLASGLQPIGVRLDDETRTVVSTLEQEDVMHNLNLLHEWYVAGYTNPDANVMTEGTKQNAFGNAQGWPAAVSAWQTQQGVEKYDAWKVFGPIYTTETIQGSMNAISANSNYKEEALKLLELVNTDQTLRDMLYYGVPDKTFQYEEDGTVTKLRDDWPLAGYTQGTFFNLSVESSAPADQYEQIKEQNEAATPSVCLGFALDPEPIQNEIANCNTVWDKYKYDLLTGASDPEEAVPRCLEELKAAGLDTVIAEAQRQVDEFFANADATAATTETTAETTTETVAETTTETATETAAE